MTIELITHKEADFMSDCFEKHSGLVLQNNGYEYLNKSKLSQEDLEAFKKAEDILRKSIKGFSKLHNLRLSKKGEKQIRFDYNYDADSPKGGYFTGVGYLLLDELLNGFKG